MAFHPYPQLIPPVFNLGGFGPPHALTRASTWPWVDHPASGPERATTLALFGLALATATPHGLTSRHATDSQAHSSKGTPPPPHTTCEGSDGLQAPGFRYYFTPLPGYFSPFPHGTHPLSVIRRYSGSQVVLADSHRIPRAPCYSGTTPDTHQPVPPTGVSPTTPRLPRRFSYQPAHAPGLRQKTNRTAPQPRTRNPCRVSHAHGFTIIRFRSPLLTEYLLLRVLRCFTSPRHPPHPIQFRCR